MEDCGWSTGKQILIGLIAPVQAFCAVGGDVHLVEEVNHAGKVVPRTVLTSLLISFTSLILLACAVLYTITDLYAVLEKPSGLLFFEITKQRHRIMHSRDRFHNISASGVPSYFHCLCSGSIGHCMKSL